MRRLLRWGWRLAGALGIVLLLVTLTPLAGWLASMLAGPWDDAQGDTLIVLTGSSLETGVLGENSYWRSVYAVLYWREMDYKTIWVTGYGEGPRTTAQLMRDFMVGQGVPADRILVDGASKNTLASADSMRSLLAADPGRKVLLTSDYHMFRARRLFRRAGLQVATLPIPDAIKRAGHPRSRWQAFSDVVEELGKIAWYGAQGKL